MGATREIQRAYYASTAANYDAMHVADHDEHYLALEYVAGFMAMSGLTSVLDVGSGTGRAVRYLAERGMQVKGVEPVPELIERAVGKNGISPDLIIRGTGESLPFPSASFDAVCEFAVLHHVPQPDKIVAEMIRVARRAIFLSDSNRFGQGPMTARVAKLALYRLGLWPLANWAKTRGRGYLLSEGDGLSYSYSVYDSLDQLMAWADRVFLLPTERTRVRSWFHPVLTSGHVLLCAMKDDRGI